MKTEEKKIWTKETYQEYLDYLKSQKNEKYREFHKRLTPTKYEILGLNVPQNRKIASKISKTDIESYLSLVEDYYYEEVLIEGFVIASLKEESTFKKYFEKFLTKIDNWAICDGFCNSLKIISQNKESYFAYILELLKKEEEPFTVRVGLIILLSFYLEKPYLKKILENVDKIKSDHYYVNMAMAWLLAEMYIKFPKEIEEYFKNSHVNSFTMNKTISKIRDSYRVSQEKKEELLKYRKKR